MKVLLLWLAVLAVLGWDSGDSFFVAPTTTRRPDGQQAAAATAATSVVKDLGNGIFKQVIAPASAEEDAAIPSPGDTVEIDYVGTIAERGWTTAQDVVDCWLTVQQGMDHLVEPFLQNDITGDVVATTLTEDFVRDTLGVENKIQCKKLVMAAKRLDKALEEFPVGTEFDSSVARGKPYSFVVGPKSKAIAAMNVGVAAMKLGETARISCQSNTAYGAEGLRQANGKVLVPPFSSLCFEVTLRSID